MQDSNRVDLERKSSETSEYLRVRCQKPFRQTSLKIQSSEWCLLTAWTVYWTINNCIETISSFAVKHVERLIFEDMLPFLVSLGINQLIRIKATCPVTCSQCMRSKWSSNDWLNFQGFIDSSLIFQKLTPWQWLLQLHRTKLKYQSNFHLIWSTFNFLWDIWQEINFLSKSWSEFESLSALHRWNKPPITASAIICFILFLLVF